MKARPHDLPTACNAIKAYVTLNQLGHAKSLIRYWTRKLKQYKYHISSTEIPIDKYALGASYGYFANCLDHISRHMASDLKIKSKAIDMLYKYALDLTPYDKILVEKAKRGRDGEWQVERADIMDMTPPTFDYCPFSTYDAKQTTAQAIYRNCYERHEPCIIKNALSTWPAIKQGKWRKNNFLKLYGDLIVKTGSRKGLQGGISTNKTTIRSFLSRNDPNNTDFVFEFFQSISKSNKNNPKLKMLFEKLKADVAPLIFDKNNNNILSFLPKEFESWKLLSVGKNGAGINYRKFSILSYITTSNALRNF